MLYLRFPLFKEKAVVLSYDDGVIHDNKFIDIISERGLKATLNVPSGLLGVAPIFQTDDSAVKTYNRDNIEVACHGFKHLYGDGNLYEYYKDFYEDKIKLEKMFKKIISGFAYANGYYNDELINIAKSIGFKYARTAGVSNSFKLPTDFYRWTGTVRNVTPELDNVVKSFLEIHPNTHWDKSPMLLFMWGHSAEFEWRKEWHILENFADKVKDDSIYKATCIEICEYVTAFRNLIYSADGNMVQNNSNLDIYVRCDDKDIVIKKYSTTIIQ